MLFVDHPWYIISVVSVCLSVCLSVCMSVCQTITFESHDVGSSFFTASTSPENTGQVRLWRSSSQGQGHGRKMSKISFYCRNVKIPVAITPVLKNIRAKRSACSMGFSATADRMVWPPSLSRDRKWTSVTKCTHSRADGLRLEGNLVYLSLKCKNTLLMMMMMMMIDDYFYYYYHHYYYY